MELLSLITKNAHGSSINSLKSNCFCDSIYKLLDYNVLTDVANSLSFMTGAKYLYSGKIVFNKDSNEIEVYYKGSDSANPIFMIISPDENKNNNGLKFNGLSDEIKKLLKADQEIVAKPSETPSIPEIVPEPPKNNLAKMLVLTIEKEEKELKNASKKNLSEKVDKIISKIDEKIEKELPKASKKTISEKVEEVEKNLDKIVKKEAVSKKVNKLLEGLDDAIKKEEEATKTELKKRKKTRKIKETLKAIDSMINENKNDK